MTRTLRAAMACSTARRTVGGVAASGWATRTREVNSRTCSCCSGWSKPLILRRAVRPLAAKTESPRRLRATTMARASCVDSDRLLSSARVGSRAYPPRRPRCTQTGSPDRSSASRSRCTVRNSSTIARSRSVRFTFPAYQESTTAACRISRRRRRSVPAGGAGARDMPASTVPGGREGLQRDPRGGVAGLRRGDPDPAQLANRGDFLSHPGVVAVVHRPRGRIILELSLNHPRYLTDMHGLLGNRRRNVPRRRGNKPPGETLVMTCFYPSGQLRNYPEREGLRILPAGNLHVPRRILARIRCHRHPPGSGSL